MNDIMQDSITITYEQIKAATDPTERLQLSSKLLAEENSRYLTAASQYVALIGSQFCCSDCDDPGIIDNLAWDFTHSAQESRPPLHFTSIILSLSGTIQRSAIVEIEAHVIGVEQYDPDYKFNTHKGLHHDQPCYKIKLAPTAFAYHMSTKYENDVIRLFESQKSETGHYHEIEAIYCDCCAISDNPYSTRKSEAVGYITYCESFLPIVPPEFAEHDGFIPEPFVHECLKTNPASSVNVVLS